MCPNSVAKSLVNKLCVEWCFDLRSLLLCAGAVIIAAIAILAAVLAPFPVSTGMPGKWQWILFLLYSV